MRQTDIAIVGGGLAGSAAAAMLGRAGYRAILIDPREVYPPDFRCEKIDTSQISFLDQTGLAKGVLDSAASYWDVWVARSGRRLEKKRTIQAGTLYDGLVKAVRACACAWAGPSGTKASVFRGKPRERLLLSRDGPRAAPRLTRTLLSEPAPWQS